MLPRDSGVAQSSAASITGRRAFLVDTLELELDLAPDATTVDGAPRLPPQSRRGAKAIATRRSCSTASSRTTWTSSSTAHRWRRRRLRLGASTLTVARPAAAGTLTVRSRIAPARNVALEGLYVSSGVFCTQCEPEGFRRITYFPDRPDVLARYTVTLRADRAAFPVLLSQRQPRRARRAAGRPSLRDVARPVSQAVVPVRARRGRPGGAGGQLHDAGRAARSRCASTRRPATSRAAVTRWRAIKSAFRWDEERFGREYDLDALHDLLRRRLQHGRDGEQGPQHLQQPARARRSRHRDRRRLRGHRSA